MIDTSVPLSPGWWLKRGFAELTERRRQARLTDLRNRFDGMPPVPNPAEAAREAYRSFQKKAHTNFESMIVGALSNRTRVDGFATAVDSDVSGDAEVGALFERTGGRLWTSEVHDWCFLYGESYAVVGPMDEATGAPIVTAEDPRWMVGLPDPTNRNRLRAALKLRTDDITGEQLAYLYMPGGPGYPRARVLVARNTMSSSWLTPSSLQQVGSPWVPTTFANLGDWRAPAPSLSGYGPNLPFVDQMWEWDPSRSGDLPHAHIPVVRYDNKDGAGEYEKHIDLLDRIAQEILNRMTIAVMQAFRQRAVKGLKTTDPTTGKEIDYSQIFVADPAAIWQLPADVEIWESGITDTRPLLEAIRDDVRDLGAATDTPLYMMSPAGQNQSAEGANMQREGLVHKAEDRHDRIGYRHAQTMALILHAAGMSDRADVNKLRTLWAPAARLSLAERADAASKAGADLPRRHRLIYIWNLSPSQADQAMSEWEEEQFALAVAAGRAAAVAAGQTDQLVPPSGPVAPVASAIPPAGSSTVPDVNVVPVPAAIAAA